MYIQEGLEMGSAVMTGLNVLVTDTRSDVIDEDSWMDSTVNNDGREGALRLLCNDLLRETAGEGH